MRERTRAASNKSAERRALSKGTGSVPLHFTHPEELGEQVPQAPAVEPARRYAAGG